jgi:two-component system sensor histidine kinase YesM
MKGKSFKASVIKRLMISFISILIPLYALAIFIYNNSLTILRREISESMASQVGYYLEELEKEVYRIKRLQAELINDKNINQMAVMPHTMSNIEQWQSLLQIQDRLFAIQNSSRYIDTVSVILPAADKDVSARTVSKFNGEEYDSMKEAASEGSISNLNGSLYLIMPYPQYDVTQRQPLFLIVVRLSKEALTQALNTMRSNEDEGVVLYRVSDGMSISTDNKVEFHNLLDELFQKNPVDKAVNARTGVIQGVRYMVVAKASDYFNAVLYRYLPEKTVFQPLEIYNVWFILFTVFALAVIVIYSEFIRRLIYNPLNRLAASFSEVARGNFKIHIQHRHEDEFRFIYQHFNAMVEELRTLIDQAYKQKMLVQRAEMKQLQSQINPHFLYNSFFILNTMIQIGDYDTLKRFTEQLGKYFQFVTRNAADDVTLSKEAEHARIYAEIQAMRYANRIQVQFDELPKEIENIVVPRLILQPIIENAFEHGLTEKTENGSLTVRFEIQQDRIRIIVENNGEEPDAETMELLQGKLHDNRDPNAEITAIQNIHQRLRLKFGSRAGLAIEPGSQGGIRVSLFVPR